MLSGGESWTVGVDLGGTKILAGRVDGGGKIRRTVRVPTEASEGPAAVKARLISAVRKLVKEAGSLPAGVGVGVAGQVDARTGAVRFAPNLGWKDEPFGGELESALKIPVSVINDVRAATWGEWLFGAGQGWDDLVCVFVGTGIGGGVVSGGRILTGCSNTAGELGHITVDLQGPTCRCGNRGCMESLAGGWAIAEQACRLVTADPKAGSRLLESSGGEPKGITAKFVAEAARAGDALALGIMDEAARALVAGAVGLVNAFNPCRFIMGGGVVAGYPGLISRVAEGIKKYALPPAQGRLKVVPARLRNTAAVVGAAALAMRSAGANRQRKRDHFPL